MSKSAGRLCPLPPRVLTTHRTEAGWLYVVKLYHSEAFAGSNGQQSESKGEGISST